MEYRDFVEQVKEQIQDFLPEKFADAAVEVNQIVKNNDCVLDGLMVRTEESNISPYILYLFIMFFRLVTLISFSNCFILAFLPILLFFQTKTYLLFPFLGQICL